MALDQTKTDAIKLALQNIDPAKLADFEAVLAGYAAGIFTEPQAQSMTDEMEHAVQEYYFPTPVPDPPVVERRGPVNTNDLERLDALGVDKTDMGDRWQLSRSGNVLYWIDKNIDKTDFESILTTL